MPEDEGTLIKDNKGGYIDPVILGDMCISQLLRTFASQKIINGAQSYLCPSERFNDTYEFILGDISFDLSLLAGRKNIRAWKTTDTSATTIPALWCK